MTDVDMNRYIQLITPGTLLSTKCHSFHYYSEVPVDLKVNKAPVWLRDLPLRHGYIAFSYIEVRCNDEPVYFKMPRCQREVFTMN